MKLSQVTELEVAESEFKLIHHTPVSLCLAYQYVSQSELGSGLIPFIMSVPGKQCLSECLLKERGVKREWRDSGKGCRENDKASKSTLNSTIMEKVSSRKRTMPAGPQRLYCIRGTENTDLIFISNSIGCLLVSLFCKWQNLNTRKG